LKFWLPNGDREARTRETFRRPKVMPAQILAGGIADAITGETVRKAFAAGDQLATELLTETADMVALC